MWEPPAPLWLHAHQSPPPFPPPCLQVLVVGSWDDWQYSLLLKKDAATGAFTCQANLNVGPGGRVPGGAGARGILMPGEPECRSRGAGARSLHMRAIYVCPSAKPG